MIQHKITYPVERSPFDCRRILIQINPVDISWLVNVVESYEAIAVPRTIDQKEGIVELLTTTDYMDDAIALIESMRDEMPVKILTK